MSTIEKAAKNARKVAVSALSHRYVTQGFSAPSARNWVRTTTRDLKSAASLRDLVKRRSLHKQGQVEQTSALAHNPSNSLSYKEYLYLAPLNHRSAWLSNRVNAYRHVVGMEEFHRTPICTVFTWRDSFDIVRLEDFPLGINPDGDGLLELIRRIGQIQVQAIRWDRGNGRVISFDGTDFAIDGWTASGEAVLDVIRKMSSNGRCVLFPYEDFAGHTGALLDQTDAVLRLYVSRSAQEPARVVQAQICAGDLWRSEPPTQEEVLQAQSDGIRRGWGKRRQRMALGERRFSHFIDVDVENGDFLAESGKHASFPEISVITQGIETLFSDPNHEFTFISVDVCLRPQGGFEIVDMSGYPRFPHHGGFNPVATEFLREVHAKQEDRKRKRGERQKLAVRFSQRIQRVKRQQQIFQMRAQGFTGRAARLWVSRVSRLTDTLGESLNSEARKAINLGFDPGFASRFGIDESNSESFLALRDYLYVQPLNGKYAKWVRDRVSARSVFKPYSNNFEPLHYQVLRRDRELQVIALSDEARRYGTDMAGISEFIRDRGKLTLFSSAWKGRTARDVEFDQGRFLLDGFAYTPDEFEKLLTFRVREQFYVLGEQVKDTSPVSSLSTIDDVHLKITMLNENGISPKVSEAFVIAKEDGTNSRTFLRKGYKLGQESEGFGSAKIAIADDEFLETQMAVDEQRADNEDPGPGHSADDIRVEDDTLDEEEATCNLVCRIDPETGFFGSARSLVNGNLRVYVEHPLSGETIARSIPRWESVVDLLQQLCVFAPQLKFVEFSVVLTADGPVINGLSATPTYSQEYAFSETTLAYLKREFEEKRNHSTPVQTVVKKWLHQTKLKTRREFAKAMYPKGLVPYQSVRWIGDMRRDLMERNGVPLKTKLWAYRNGFLSYRIPQYGITEENRHEFISDLEYRWLRHINKKYKYWLEDKISIKYVAAEFNDCLPAYYFYTTAHEGQNTVVPMMDCPEGYEASFSDVLRLVQEKGVLALKPDEGSHGDGFYRLDYSEDGYALNGELASEQQVLDILQDTNNQYLVTEFIQMHPVLAEIYPHSVNTIRLLVFKKDGVTPEIGNAYLRIGSLKSGYVDNTAAGGMLAQIDPATGRFGNAQILENGRVADCPRHPDTGTLIEGVIPHWDYAVNKVLEISASLPQLEYLGFDLAITPDGIMLPEINRSPDFPRIDKLTPATIDYLLYKLDKKKTMFGYDLKRPKKLISLPERNQV